MTPQHSRTSRRLTWRPGRGLWLVLGAAFGGSLFGLVFGLTSLNRPFANAVVFYVLGGVVAAALAGVLLLLARAVAAARARRDDRHR